MAKLIRLIILVIIKINENFQLIAKCDIKYIEFNIGPHWPKNPNLNIYYISSLS